jgi:hypothetical protein
MFKKILQKPEEKIDGKRLLIVCGVIGILLVLAGILSYLNWSCNSEQRERDSKGAFIITANGKQYEVTLEKLKSMNPIEITANYKKSGKAPVPTKYKGVPLSVILENLDIDTSKTTSVSAMASDGYASAFTIAEALDPEQAFIAYEQEGKSLGTKTDGGSGPLMLVLAKDTFSQRWVKYLSQIQLTE